MGGTMHVLGVETSCDETAAAVVNPDGRVLSSVVASQLALHAPFGGVVPELASRQHLRDLPRVATAALTQAGLTWEEIGGVAATHGPGLMGALLVGLSWGKAAAFARGLPFVGVNHLEGHLAAAELTGPPLPRPFLGLVASGGHTSLYRVEAGPVNHYQLLAKTRDDAVGEAFDKVAKLLGLGYPGGPAIEQAAKTGNPEAFKLPLPRIKDGTQAFSYSGLKTAVRSYLDHCQRNHTPVFAPDVAAVFQKTIVQDVVSRTMAAAQSSGARAVALTGGVAANRALRAALAAAVEGAGLVFFCPPVAWCTDNAAMIALAGLRRLRHGERSAWNLPAVPGLAL